jgi:hypothetical protein
LADISKINAVALANIAKLDAVLAANLAKVNGLVFSTAPAFTGLLDTYTGAAVAYSVRRLFSGYTGAALRVRRDSDNTEQDIGFDANGDLDVTALTTFVGSGNNGYIRTVYDQSQTGGTGSGTDITNSTPTTQPKIYDATSGLLTDGINGRALLTFTRGSSILRGGPAITGPWTCIGTARNTGYGCRYVANDNNYFILSGRASYSFVVNNVSYLNAGGPGASVFTTGIWVENDTNSYVQWNSANSTGSASGTVPALDIVANAYYGGNGNQTSWNELIFWDIAQSASNYNGINGDMNSYYGIGNFGTPTSGLLATYTGAAAAYSVRQLANTAALSMRVREDATDTETNIGFDANGALDTAAIAAHCGTANGYVVNWFDQAGSQNDATQSTLASQPKIYDGTTQAVITENGKPAVEFDGSDDGLATSNIIQSFTYASLFVAYKSTSIQQQNIVRYRPNGFVGTKNGWIYEQGPDKQYGGNTLIGAGVNAVGAIVSGEGGSPTLSQHLLAMLFEQSQVLAYENGTLDATLNTVKAGTTPVGTASVNDEFWLGRNNDSNDRELEGKMQEVIIYHSDQSTNRTGIETDINTEYLIYQPTDAPTSGLLATYTGAAAAYSVRQLANTAVMSMRVRRDSDDVEQNFGFDSNGDLDTAGIASFCGTANGYVTRWWDQSTNGNHADQATDASQPQIYNGTAVITENGKPILYAANGNVSLSNGLAGNANAYVFSVVDIHITAVLLSDQGQTDWYMAARSGIGNTAHNNITISNLYKNGNSVTYTSQNDAWVGMNQDQSLITGDINTSVVSNYTLGYTSTASYGAYDYQELIIYHSDQSTNRTGIETDINTYFSIY